MTKEKAQLDIFDLISARKLRDEGLEIACQNKTDAVKYAQALAESIARSRQDGTCTIDDVQAVLIPEGIILGMAAGSVFRGGSWFWTGEMRQSKRTTNHARPVKVWALKGL